MLYNLLAVYYFLIASWTAVQSAPLQDLVSHLPGVNFEVDFKQYSGYLKGSSKHYLHYWFVYSQNNPSIDPVLLWLNGGPGCSSLIGLLEELGPFRVKDNGNILFENIYSWNKVANIIFIESPVGVGFSYTTDKNTTTNDDMTAMDNYYALIDFFTNKFPEFHSNEFYITGESYAGFYLPLLGKLLVEDTQNFSMFKGMAIGNGLLNYPLLVNTLVPMLYYHGLISEMTWNWLGNNCCNGNPDSCNYFKWYHKNTTECFLKIVKVAYVNLMNSHMDNYNLYASCYLPSNILFDESNPRGAFYHRFFEKLGMSFRKVLLDGNSINGKHVSSHRLIYKSQYEDMVSEVNEIINKGVKILIYNGDTDTACNAIGNQMFVNQLNAKVLQINFDYKT